MFTVHSSCPDPEQLAAAASDILHPRVLTAHLGQCVACRTALAELRELRGLLASLPDVAPSRPLRLLPPVDPAPAPAPGLFGLLRRRSLAAPLWGVALTFIAVGSWGSVDGLANSMASSPATTVSDARNSELDEAPPSAALFETSPEALPEQGLPSGDSAGGAEAAPGATAAAEEFAAASSDVDQDVGGPINRLFWPALLFQGLLLALLLSGTRLRAHRVRNGAK